MTIADEKKADAAATSEHGPAVRNGAFRTPAPGREVKYALGGVEKSMFVLAEAAQTDRRVTVAIHHLAPGEESGFHMHTLEDEGFFVLEGSVTVNMPHDDLVIEAGKGEFIWHPVGRAHSLTAGPDPVKVLQFLVPGTELVPRFFEKLSTMKTETPEELEALADLSLEEFGVRTYGPDGPPPSTRPALSRGPMTPDARLLRPEEADRMLNVPFKSNRDDKLKLNIGRGAMTGTDLTFHAWGHQTGDLFEMMEVKWHAPDIIFPHVHTLEEEGFYILDGEFTLYVAEPGGAVTKQIGRAGDFLWGPRDWPHYYHITGEKGAHLLAFLVPGGGGFQKFFYEVATKGKGADLSTPEKLLEWQQWVSKISGQFFLGPDEWPGVFPSPDLAL
jgi:quercetin dioxygenase-like cupin family protein